MTFHTLHSRLQTAISHTLGWKDLRDVQHLSNTAILNGRNAVVLAPTAGGKTEASIFPTLSMLLEDPTDSIGALYIAPIKALLNNQSDRLGQYTEMVGLRRFVWHGDQTATEKRRFINHPDELLMTTPESLEVMFISSKIPVQKFFEDLRIVIIDEVHALAGSDRGAHLMSMIERLNEVSRHDVQRVGLSATVGNPQEILRWLTGSSKRAGEVVDPPKAAAKRELLITCRDSLEALARDAAVSARGHKSLFFCQSRATTESVATRIRGAGTTVFVHHSSVSKEEREEAEARFSGGKDVCIVCTSTLELGIDVGDLDKVFQANATDTVSSFMQRMGRTGRRPGQSANTTFFCESPETVLQAIALIELAKKGWVESVEVNDRCWPVLVHQLLATPHPVAPPLTLQQPHRRQVRPVPVRERLHHQPTLTLV
ncbi:MAG: DEAD/DEAH box helicase, partial [Bradymonadaceae bacterium]